MEFKEEFEIFMSEEVDYRQEEVDKFLKKEGVSAILKLTKERLERVEEFTLENIERELRALVEESHLEGKDLIHPLRVAVTGKSVSAGIFEVLALLGKAKTIQRLGRVIEKVL